MMSGLFDEEYFRDRYGKAEAKRNCEKSWAEGKAETLKCLYENLLETGFSKEQIRKAVSVQNDCRR